MIHTNGLSTLGRCSRLYYSAVVDVYCQAWLRMCFNGCDLQCYLSLIINDAAQLRSVSHWNLLFLIADLKLNVGTAHVCVVVVNVTTESALAVNNVSSKQLTTQNGRH